MSLGALPGTTLHTSPSIESMNHADQVLANPTTSDAFITSKTNDSPSHVLTGTSPSMPDPPEPPVPGAAGGAASPIKRAQSRVSLSLQANAVGRRFFINPSPSDKFVNFDPASVGPQWIRSNAIYPILFYPYLRILKSINESKRAGAKNPFIDNTVRTARYTLIDFIPRQIIVQFSKVANIYFFLVSMLQIIPGVSPTGRFTTIFPLSFFVIVSMLKEAYDDYFRHKQDAAENNAPVHRLVVTEPNLPVRNSIMRKISSRAPSNAPGEHVEMNQLKNANTVRAKEASCVGDWGKSSCKDIRVGDIIRLRDREFVPADMIVLASTNADGICFIETSNLDGETNLKQRQALKVTTEAISDLDSLANFKAMIHTESPSGDLYSFDGYLQDAAGNRYPLTPNQFLQRGSTLRNTKEVFAVAVYTGEESKIRMNSYAPPNAKVPHVGLVTNKVIILILAFLLLFSGFGTIVYVLWDSKERKLDASSTLRHWYLTDNSGYSLVFFTYLILFNAFIPLSLYVTMEVVKVVQVIFMMNDLAMYDAERDIPAQANTSSLNEELGQVQYVFSDKTGTLTENVMEFRLFSVAGRSIRHPSCPPREDDSEDGSVVIQELSIARLRGVPLTPKQQQMFDFLQAMALCHSVVPDLSQAQIDSDLPPFNSEEKMPNVHTVSSIVYQSSSADEVAIVNAARDLSFIYKTRTPTTLTLNLLSQMVDSDYQILNTIEFTSDRKRMSTVYRYPDGRLMLLTKGADNVILERLRSDSELSAEDLEIKAKTLRDTEDYATEGLRTLLYAYKELDPAVYEAWDEKYAEATTSIVNRAAAVAAVAEELERGLTLLGATAIEDKLQEGVPDTIENLRRANIRVWMLTGDKTETAINIGRTCNLIKKDSHLMLLNDDSLHQQSRISNPTDIGPIQAWIETAITKFLDLKRDPNNKEKIVSSCHILVAVEGRLLSRVEKHLASHEDSPVFERLLDLLIAADNVICCRFSPAQKALLVRKVKERLNAQHSAPGGASPVLQELSGPPPTPFQRVISTLMLRPRQSGVTLAIGDGANDIPMLLCAHVGIGITGREGLAASRASDYSIAKFRFLQPLLFVHGRWSYVRICLFTLGTLYKNITFYGTQMIFQFWCGYSGTSLYEQWTLSLNNVLFTSLPVMVVGVFEKDLNRSTLMAVPELYRYGQQNKGFNFRITIRWFFQAFLHATLSVLLPAILYGGFSANTGTGNLTTPLFFGANSTAWFQQVLLSDATGPYQETGLYPLGTISYTITILFCTIKVLYIESHNITSIHHIIGGLTFLVWIGYQFVYSYIWSTKSVFGAETAYEYSGLFYPLINSQIRFWMIVILAVVVGLVLEDYSVKFFELLAQLVSWGYFGGRQDVVEVGGQTQPSQDVSTNGKGPRNNYEMVSEEAKIAAAHAVGEHNWADEVAWWQFWEKAHGIGSSLFSDPTTKG